MKAESSMLDQPATGLSEPTQAYCVALLSQEKSLGELQRHLHKTEALFRESVQRKNQQLDLLLAEVRRLSANAAGREAKASEHFESSLDAQRIELGRLRQQLATRETEVGMRTGATIHTANGLNMKVCLLYTSPSPRDS